MVLNRHTTRIETKKTPHELTARAITSNSAQTVYMPPQHSDWPTTIPQRSALATPVTDGRGVRKFPVRIFDIQAED